jgi:hypothetical protein
MSNARGSHDFQAMTSCQKKQGSSHVSKTFSACLFIGSNRIRDKSIIEASAALSWPCKPAICEAARFLASDR